MPERINGGFALAGIGALLLFVSLFLNWFEPSRSAWTVFEIEDMLLAALAVLALYSVVRGLRASERPASLDAIIRYAGVAALIIIVATLIQHPPAAQHSSPQIGAWLALLGAAMVTLGGILLRARVSIVVTLRPREKDSTVRVAGRPEGTMPSPSPAGDYEFEPELEPEPEFEPEPELEPEELEPADYESEDDADYDSDRTETQPIRDTRR